MATLEFQIPLSREELTERGERVQYVVSEQCTANELTPRLDDCKTTFAAQGPSAIRECFDVFYSLLSQFNSVCVAVREAYWRLALQGLRDQYQTLAVLELMDLSHERKANHRNTLKMLVYTVVQLVEDFESEATKPDALAAAAPRGRKGSKKKAVASQSSVGLNWATERETVMELLCQVADLDLPQLWDPPTPRMTEDCCNLMASCCYKMMENPTFGREKELRERIVHLLGTIVKKYNQALGVSLKIIQLLQHFEHLVSPMAQMVSAIANSFEAKNMVADVIREIGSKDPHDLTLDTSGTRCFAAFLVELAQCQAEAILPIISVLLPHLSGESYTMRNGVLGVIGEVVSHVLPSPGINEQAKMARDGLLDKLEDHLHDVNAFVRSRTLQIWLQLGNNKVIPLRRQKDVLELVVGRVEDKSSNVRKSALHLLSAFLAGNPFSSKLDESEFVSNLRAEETKLRSMLPPPETEVPPGEEGGVATSQQEDEVAEELEGGVASSQQEGEVAGELEVAKQMAVVQYLRDGLSFIQTLSKCIPVIVQLLGSKVISDVLESLEFLATAFEFGLRGSQTGVRKALALVWSREQPVREAVVAVYVRLYLNPQIDDARQRTMAVVCNLIALMEGATCGDLTSLEEMVSLLVASKHLKPSIIKTLWDMFMGKIPGTSVQDSRSALLLLSMAGNADPDILKSNVDVLVTHGLISAGGMEGGTTDLLMAKHTCIALQKVVKSRNLKGGIAEKSHRLPSSHQMFQTIVSILLERITSLDTSQWTPFAQQAISTIYKLSEQPDALCEALLRSLWERVFSAQENDQQASEEISTRPREAGEEEEQMGMSSSINSLPENFEPLASSSQDPGHPPSPSPPETDPILLSRLLFTAGHVAQCQVVHLEVGITNELKRRRYQTEDGGPAPAVIPAQTPGTVRRGKTPRKRPATSTDSPSIEEEMGLAGAAADDAEAELIRKVCETEVGGSGMLTAFEPLIVTVVTNPSKYPSASLQASATLALAKYMLISAPMCDKYLRLLFTILEKSPEAVVRANTIIAAGDLTFRYPNITEPWTPFLYSRLSDSSSAVRKNTLVVLARLILNDMVKVKGQISELALCLEDPEKHISDLTRLFFFELSKKGNALYNVLPDIISHLSDPEGPVPPVTFERIVKYLFAFIQKDKQCESLVEKLCHRFRATRTERQWHDLSHCLAQLNFTDRCIRKLQDNFSCFQDKLADPKVFGAFTSILNKAKKFPKPETKAMVEELERKVQEAHRKGLEEAETTSTHREQPLGANSQQEGEGEEVVDEEGKADGQLPDQQESPVGEEEEGGKENSPQKVPLTPPPPPPASARKKTVRTAAKSTARRSRRKPQSTRKPLTESTNHPLPPPPCPHTPLPKEPLGLSDDDFQTDILSSARRVPLSSARRVPLSSAHSTRRRGRDPPTSSGPTRSMRKVLYSSSEEEEEGGGGEGRRVSQMYSGKGKVQQLVFSDEDD